MNKNSSWQLGVCYYPEHWSKKQWGKDADTMCKLGITRVRIGEFAWKFIEPTPGEITLEWLDEIIAVLAARNIGIILGTPTATPPRWMLSKHPNILAWDENSRPRKFGSRRHYCFSSKEYKEECRKIVNILAMRYANNKNIIAWQTDNEYGCHNTTYSYSPAAENAFKVWLSKKYATIQSLNKAWGNDFWSMGYDNFTEVSLPNETVAEANPAHWLDFVRFSSDQVKVFNKLQCDEIRKFNSEVDIIHNFMGQFIEFDHYDVGQDLQIASWDSYPLGFLQVRNNSNTFKQKYANTGDPDFQSFHHELYRGVCNGRWWVMEQQPGPVNWAPINTAPQKGAVRLWAWEAFSHGAEVVSFFRFRQCPFAQEQMHAGLLLPNNHLDEGGKECAVLKEELLLLQKSIDTNMSCTIDGADVALVFDYVSEWTWRIQPQNKNFSYFELIFTFYKQLRKLGYQVSIVSSQKLISTIKKNNTSYSCVFLPGFARMEKKLQLALNNFKNSIVIGPRAFAKDENFSIPNNLPPNYDTARLPLQVVRTEGLAEGVEIKVDKLGASEIWREQVVFLDNSVKTILKDETNMPVLVKKDNVYYLAAWPNNELLKNILSSILNNKVQLPSGVRITRYKNLLFLFNYGKFGHSTEKLLKDIPVNVSPIDGLSAKSLSSAGVAVYKLSDV